MAFIEDFLAQSTQVLRLRLAPGMGILANNVLHDRESFIDEPTRPRLLYRARYLDRIASAAPGLPVAPQN